MKNKISSGSVKGESPFILIIFFTFEKFAQFKILKATLFLEPTKKFIFFNLQKFINSELLLSSETAKIILRFFGKNFNLFKQNLNNSILAYFFKYFSFKSF